MDFIVQKETDVWRDEVHAWALAALFNGQIVNKNIFKTRISHRRQIFSSTWCSDKHYSENLGIKTFLRFFEARLLYWSAEPPIRKRQSKYQQSDKQATDTNSQNPKMFSHLTRTAPFNSKDVLQYCKTHAHVVINFQRAKHKIGRLIWIHKTENRLRDCRDRSPSVPT